MKMKIRVTLCFALVFSLVQVSNFLVSAAGNKMDFYLIENYIIPNSDKVLLAEKDLFHLSAYNIDFARNEIYARHGYIFKNETYSSYFSSKPWYKKNKKFKESMLNNTEKKNVEFLWSYSSNLKANFHKINGNEFSIDLNGDGIKDKINLKCSQGDREYTLTVNNTKINGSGDNLDGIMYVADINTKDKYKEIAITESGPSDDSNTYFYYYNGSKLIYMGKVQGNNYSLKINGSGKFITKTRGAILQTWFYSDEYKLSANHKLFHITEKYRKMNTIVTVKKPLKLQKSPTDSSPILTLKTGQKIFLTDTDNEKWCAVETADGQKGWFSTSSLLNINSIPATDYFDGLYMVD